MDTRKLVRAVPWALVVAVLLLPVNLLAAQSQTVYAATSNGVFKTTDAGASWFSANAGIAADTFSIVIDPSDPQIVYAGTLGAGVFKTTDGGATWFPAGMATTVIQTLAVDPNDPQTLYASAWGSRYFSGCLFKTTDGGANWNPAYNGLPDAVVTVLATDSSNPAVIYAGTNWVGTFKTTDGGANWTPANKGLLNTYVSALTVDPSDPALVYLGNSGCSFNCAKPAGFFRSADAGMNWANSNTGLTDFQVISLAADPKDPRILYAGTRLHGLFKSVDYGTTWVPIGPRLRPTMYGFDHFPLVLDPLDTTTVYSGGTDGVFKSTDAGLSWTASNNGLPAETRIFDLAVAPPFPPTIESLITRIEEADLQPDVKFMLISDLNAARAAVERGNLREARDECEVLISQVAALRQNGELDVETADSLIAGAKAVIENLTLNPKPRFRRERDLGRTGDNVRGRN